MQSTSKSRPKPPVIHVRSLKWSKAGKGRKLTAEGYELVLAPETDGWSWTVSSDGNVIDSGTAKREAGAEWAAGIAANRALKARPKAAKAAA